MNRHLGRFISVNYSERVSYRGKQLVKLLETGKYILVNSSNLSSGGPYTWYDPSDPKNDSKKSILDLCLVSEDLFLHVESLTIDQDLQFTPYRVIGQNKVTFTDHYSLKLVLKNLLRKKGTGSVFTSEIYSLEYQQGRRMATYLRTWWSIIGGAEGILFHVDYFPSS